MSKTCPCKDCTERFLTCSDKCPKDARGEFGYKAWKTERDAAKNALQLEHDINWTIASKGRARRGRAKNFRR